MSDQNLRHRDASQTGAQNGGASQGRNPLVSVIVTVYNTAQYVGEAIDSILAQTYSPMEVVIVDDGSTDNVQDVLAAYSGRIRVIRQENRGPAGALNTGVQAANGDFMAVLDSDDVWMPDKLARQMTLFKTCPEMDFVFANSQHMDEDGNDVHIFSARMPPPVDYRKEVMKDGYLLVGDWPAALAYHNFIPHSTIVARLPAVRAVGGYDPQRRVSLDYRLYWSLISHGASFGFLNTVLMKYRRHATQVTKNSVRYFEDRTSGLKDILARSKGLSWATRHNLKQRLARLYKKAGDDAFRWGERRTARKDYLEAFRYGLRPGQIASWAATLLGPFATDTLMLINHGSDVFDEVREKASKIRHIHGGCDLTEPRGGRAQ